MVNGNYVLYGDKSSESEIIDDHVLHTRSTVERKNKRKCNRTANDLQRTLNLAQLDNETDSVKYEKRIKEPRLLRYVSNADVEENFVTEKFETYDLQATEERPRRYAFQKKTKNPADGSVNYAYSRSSSSCSSPNGNLPTISEHSEQQYGTYRVRPIQSPKIGEIINGFETKHDKFLTKPKDMKFGANVTYKGSHPDSLYRVPTESGVSGDKFTKMLRILRWPIALIAICIALAVFVYFLMPDNIDGRVVLKNITEFADGPTASESKRYKLKRIENAKKQLQGTKTAEIDFYDNETGDKTDITDSITETILHRKLTVEPIFPTHIAPEVQYGNERADNDKLRIPKILDDTLPNSTKRPHITHKPEKPLEVYIKEAMEVSTDAINRAETVNELANYDEKQTTQRIDANIKTYTPGYKDPSIGTKSFNDNDYTLTEPRTLPEIQELHSRQPPNVDVNFTSGHSKLFGISIEDAEKMMSTTQSSLYNTRVSPTLPTWRSNDETTTKKFPANFEIPQCRSTRLTLCRGILPYDLAGSPATAGGLHVTSLLPQIEYLVATNCSDRVRHFACALMEPECKPPPFPIKKPCKNLCRAITEYCEDFIPQELASLFRCSEYSERNCVAARAPCFDREHRCKDGTCIPRDWLCDGSADCPGGDDEAICATCATNEFSCHGGTCIPQRWLCDGYADCPDGQDESENCDRRTPASELGEEPSGSAPAVAIRKLNILPGPDRARGETDNSKELLVTSDSNNALKRNYTRRPSASRLTPYTRKSIQTGKNEGTNQNEQEPHRKRKPSLKNTTLRPSFNESGEEINVGDLGFFEDFKKTSIAEGAAAQSGDDHKMYRKPSTRTRKPVTTTRLDKTINRLEKVIDGSALLKKAAEAEHLDTVESNTTSIEKEDYIPKHQRTGPGSSHASPCPSGELRCVDGRCITLAQLCDGTIDCTDHADEDNCYT